MNTYTFRFIAYHAKLSANGSVKVDYDRRPIYTEEKTCTLTEAIVHLPLFSSDVSAPHSAEFTLTHGACKPYEFDRVRKHFYSLFHGHEISERAQFFSDNNIVWPGQPEIEVQAKVAQDEYDASLRRLPDFQNRPECK